MKIFKKPLFQSLGFKISIESRFNKRLPSFIATFLLLTALPLTAIPGVKDILPTESGQYVYYRDNGFRAETYIGFLQYDEGRYAIRYYSPNPESGSNEIELLITVDPTQDYILMTGELIVGNVTAEDNETVNYMHDIFYELSSRRKKMNGRDFTGTNPLAQNIFSSQASTLETFDGTVRSTEDFPQFGGEVTLTYDFTIPIFNLRSISSATTSTVTGIIEIPLDGYIEIPLDGYTEPFDDKYNDTEFEIELSGESVQETRGTLLMAVTMGQLTDSDDLSFSNFTGIPDVPVIILADEKLTETQINESWIPLQDGAWILNSDAFLRIYEIEIDQAAFENQNYTDLEYLSRKFSFAYPPDILRLSSLSISMKNDSLVIENLVYAPDTQFYTHVTTIIRPPSSQSTFGQTKLYTIVSISAYYNYYYNNIGYFQSKVKLITE